MDTDKSNNENKIARLKIKSDINLLDTVLSTIAGVASLYKLNSDEIQNLSLVISE